MPTSDPNEILLRQNYWATSLLIEACRPLNDEQFNQRFEMGVGSLHDSITHILGAMQGWGDLLAGREQRDRLEGTTRSIDELNKLLESINDDLSKSVRSHPNDELVSGSRGGRDYTFARGAVLVHVMTHGMHHRAQCLNMLRQLGVDPLPASSVVEWVMMADSPQ